MNKVVQPCLVKCGQVNLRAFCKVQFKNGRLSISGVIGPTTGGHCVGSCGQIRDDLPNPVQYGTGWNAELLNRFLEIWERWHLNDMQAGTPAQMEAVREGREAGLCKDYDATCEYLKARGLYEVEHEGKPYKYGHAWLTEPVPQDVLDFLASLPDTDVTPAWV